MTQAELIGRLQYTNVRANATLADIRTHCETAARYGFQAVMLQPCWVELARSILGGTKVSVATAICYPMGGETVAMKTALAREVVRLGADEFDFQPNIGLLRSGLRREFLEEIRAIVEAADGRSTKSMSEFGFLNEEERVLAITLAEEGGVDYVKNSSGIGPGGSPATPEVIRFMRAHLTGKARIKASGQIRSYSQTLALIEAGAHLIGTSAAPAIADGQGVETSAY
jgi:deoxyribose-phosphate aldolase